MPLMQVWDVPDQIYRLLAEQAEREHRSLAQQVVAVLARGLDVDLDAGTGRRALLDSLRAGSTARAGTLRNPALLIRADRRR
jgi:hypothetical protein